MKHLKAVHHLPAACFFAFHAQTNSDKEKLGIELIEGLMITAVRAGIDVDGTCAFFG